MQCHRDEEGHRTGAGRCRHLHAVAEVSSSIERPAWRSGAVAGSNRPVILADATSSVAHRTVLCGHGMRRHIGDMDKPHPQAEATYRVPMLDGGASSVEAIIPNMHPTRVTVLTPADSRCMDMQSRTTGPLKFFISDEISKVRAKT
jgi:hypothetical protein